jgi:hypothetical protein
MKHLPSLGLKHTQSAVPAAALHNWAKSLRHWIVKLLQRAHCKSPNARGIFRQLVKKALVKSNRAYQYAYKNPPWPPCHLCLRRQIHHRRIIPFARAQRTRPESLRSRRAQCYNGTYKTPLAKQRKGEGRFAYQAFGPHSPHSRAVVLALRSHF